MSQLPGYALTEDMLVIDDDGKVSRVLNVDLASMPQTYVFLSLKDQVTGDLEERQVTWQGRQDVTKGLTVEVGSEGSVTVELARMAPKHLRGTQDDSNRHLYRYEIRDQHGEEIESEADVRSAVGEDINHEKVMGSLLSFLGAAANAYATEMSGRSSENSDLFSPRVKEWTYQNSTEIQCASLELDGERSAADD